MTKIIEVSVDIPVARKMLGVAGYVKEELDAHTDEEIFDMALDTSSAYGVSFANTSNKENPSFALEAIHSAANLVLFLQELPFFNELDRWSFENVHYNCSIDNKGVLFDNEGNKLSADGRCMDEDIPYFVNQSCGYCGDDYSGRMFVRVDDKNTFVEINYEC